MTCPHIEKLVFAIRGLALQVKENAWSREDVRAAQRRHKKCPEKNSSPLRFANDCLAALKEIEESLGQERTWDGQDPGTGNAQLERVIRVFQDAAKYLREEARAYRGAADTVKTGDKKHLAALERAEAALDLAARLDCERGLLEAPGALEVHGGP